MKNILYSSLLMLSCHMNCFSFEIAYVNESKNYTYSVASEDLIASAQNYYGSDYTYSLDVMYTTVFYLKDNIVSEIVAEIVKKGKERKYSSWILYNGRLQIKADTDTKVISEKKVIVDGEIVGGEVGMVSTGIRVSHPSFPRKEWKSESNQNKRNDAVVSLLKPINASFFTKESIQKINNVKLIRYLNTGERLEVAGKDLLELVFLFLQKGNISIMDVSLDKKDKNVIYFELYDDVYPTKRNIYTFAVGASFIPDEIMTKFPTIMRNE